MKCSKLIDKLQQLEYELDDPDVLVQMINQYDPDIEIRVEDYPTGKVVVIG
jgi:hypothetical protein